MTTTAALRDLDPATLRAPWSLYESWRARGPVVALPELGGWAVTDVALASAILRDGDAWSSDSVEGPVAPERDRWMAELAQELPELRDLLGAPLQTLLALDPPDHGRLRTVLMPWFSAANVRRLEPLVDELVAELLPELVTGESVDAVAAFAHELPLRVIATLLGLPRERWREFARVAIAASTSNPHLEDKPALRARLEAELHLMRWFTALLAEPAADLDVHGLLAGLRDAVADGRLSTREATGLCRELLVAGADSTVNHLSSALLLLATEPGVMDRLQHEPERLGSFIEEALRLEPPFPGFWRRARTPVELGGIALPEDGLLLIPFAALNRDPERFPGPHDLDLDRPAPRKHLSFGHGLHFCLGAPLVRLQSAAAFRALLSAARAIELAVDAGELRPVPSIQDRGVVGLPLRVTPARPRAPARAPGASPARG